MHTDELITWLLDTTETIVSSSSAVSLDTPSNHVDVAEAFDDSTYPFVGIVPISMIPLSGGLGNEELYATGDVTDTNGNTDGVEHTLRREFSIEITPVTDDDFGLRDRLTDEVTLGFAERSDAGETPDDIRQLSIGESTPSGRPESFVRANGMEVSGVLHTRRERVLPTAETVTWSVTSETTPAYPDEY